MLLLRDGGKGLNDDNGQPAGPSPEALQRSESDAADARRACAGPDCNTPLLWTRAKYCSNSCRAAAFDSRRPRTKPDTMDRLERVYAELGGILAELRERKS